MTRKEKELLLKDLCARFPYGVKVQYYFDEGCGTWRKETATLKGYNQKRTGIDGVEFILERTTPKGSYRTSYESWSIKPYLRPVSSMTDEETDRMWEIYESGPAAESSVAVAEYLYGRHLDCHHLIEKGLADEAPEGMYE